MSNPRLVLEELKDKDTVDLKYLYATIDLTSVEFKSSLVILIQNGLISLLETKPRSVKLTPLGEYVMSEDISYLERLKR